MAYEALEAQFRQLGAHTPDSVPALSPDRYNDHVDGRGEPHIYSEDGSWDNGSDSGEQDGKLTAEAPLELRRKLSVDEPTPTPPIEIPAPHYGSSDERRVHGEVPHPADYFEEGSMESFLRQRRPSVSFDPQVTLESGHRAALEEPLPRLKVRTRVRGRSLLHEMTKRPSFGKARSETDGERYDSDTGELLEKQDGALRDIRYMQHQPRYPLLQSTVDELALILSPSDLARSASLTSDANPSPVLEDVRTPSDTELLNPISPLSTSSPLSFNSSGNAPTSKKSASTWPSSHRALLSQRSQSYTYDPSSSGRRNSRRRQTSNTSISPASAFLSNWNTATSPLLEADSEGQEVGDYVLGREIGFGGFSIVREAFTLSDPNTTSPIRITRAVKIVRRHVPGKEEAENDRVQAEWEHEIALWRCLSHRNILPLLAVYVTDFATFAFTEIHRSGTLFDLVRKCRDGLPSHLAQRYSGQLVSALRYLHEDMRIVHRDLKLENCLLDLEGSDAAYGGRVLLCDFGLADYLTGESNGHSQASHRQHEHEGVESDSDESEDSGHLHAAAHTMGPSATSTSLAGSLPYAAPEMLNSSRVILSTAADMWAFGVCVYALITGDLPFQHSFAPRVRMLILGAEWDRDKARRKVQAWAGASTTEQERAGATDLISGCLQRKVSRRWDVRACYEGQWLSSAADEGRNAWSRC